MLAGQQKRTDAVRGTMAYMQRSVKCVDTGSERDRGPLTDHVRRIRSYSQTSSSETTLPSESYLRIIFFLGWLEVCW